MGDWETYRIGDIAEVFDGPHATPKKTQAGPWFLSISSLDRGRLNLDASAHLSEQDFTKWTTRVAPKSGDVLFSYETRLGEAALMPTNVRACLGRRMGLLRPNLDRVTPRFLTLAFLAPEFQATIQSRKIDGATVDRIPLAELPRWPIRIPKLAEQKRIGEALGSLDDKIVANERSASTADELAVAIHRNYVESKSVIFSRLEDIATVVVGGTPSRKRDDFWTDGDTNWISSGKTNDFRILEPTEKITTTGLEKSSVKLMPAGSTVMGITGATMGRVSRLEIQAGGSQNVAGIWCPSIALNNWAFFWIREHIGDFTKHATGGAQQHINKTVVAGAEIGTIGHSALEEWNLKVSPLLDYTAQCLRQNFALTALRDTLLPQLMSGKLRVRDAERIVEDAT